MATAYGQAALAAGGGGFVAASSDNIYHGLSQSMGDPSLSIDGHYRTDHDEFAGVTLATVKLNAGPSAPLEVGVYLGRGLDLGEDWSARGLLAYAAYPGNPSKLPYDYAEAMANVTWRDRVTVSASVSPDTSRYSPQGVNRHRPAQSLELAAHRPISPIWSLAAGIGYRHFAAPLAAGYVYGNLGLSAVVNRWQVDLAAIDSGRRARLLFGDDAAARRLVLTVAWRFGADAPAP